MDGNGARFFNVGLVALMLWAFWQFGSISTARAFLRGDRLIADAYLKSVGDVVAGQAKTLTFDLTNMGKTVVSYVD